MSCFYSIEIVDASSNTIYTGYFVVNPTSHKVTAFYGDNNVTYENDYVNVKSGYPMDNIFNTKTHLFSTNGLIFNSPRLFNRILYGSDATKGCWFHLVQSDKKNVLCNPFTMSVISATVTIRSILDPLPNVTMPQFYSMVIRNGLMSPLFCGYFAIDRTSQEVIALYESNSLHSLHPPFVSCLQPPFSPTYYTEPSDVQMFYPSLQLFGCAGILFQSSTLFNSLVRSGYALQSNQFNLFSFSLTGGVFLTTNYRSCLYELQSGSIIGSPFTFTFAPITNPNRQKIPTLPDSLSPYIVLSPEVSFLFGKTTNDDVVLTIDSLQPSLIGFESVVCSNRVMVSNPNEADQNDLVLSNDSIGLPLQTVETEINTFNTTCWYDINPNNNSLYITVNSVQTLYVFPSGDYTLSSFIEAWYSIVGTDWVLSFDVNQMIRFSYIDSFTFQDIPTQRNTNSIFPILGFLSIGREYVSNGTTLVAESFSLFAHFQPYYSPTFSVNNNSVVSTIEQTHWDTHSVLLLYNTLISLTYTPLPEGTEGKLIKSGNYLIQDNYSFPETMELDFENSERTVFVFYSPNELKVKTKVIFVGGGDYKRVFWLSKRIIIENVNIKGVFVSESLYNEGGRIEGSTLTLKSITISKGSNNLYQPDSLSLPQEYEYEPFIDEVNSNHTHKLSVGNPLLNDPPVEPNQNSVRIIQQQCCKKEVLYKELITGGNNPQITKAMKYSQYIKNKQNRKTVIN
jgi:hypothetical protein